MASKRSNSQNKQASAKTSASTVSSGSRPRQRRKKKRFLSRKFKQHTSLLARFTVFMAVIITTVVIGYDFVEGFYQERLANQQVKAEQIIPVYDLKLSLQDQKVSFLFFLENTQVIDSSELTTNKFSLEHLTIKKRNNLPYPYLKATCPEGMSSCTFEEAESFILYLKEEDIQGVQIF